MKKKLSVNPTAIVAKADSVKKGSKGDLLEQASIEDLFGTIEYGDSYSYKKFRSRSNQLDKDE